MNHYTNPFHTLENVVATLESLGVHPLSNDSAEWVSHIIGISVDKCFTEDYEPYYETTLHVSAEGFIKFLDIITWVWEKEAREDIIARGAHTEVGTRLEMHLDTNLKMLAYVSVKQLAIIYGEEEVDK